MPGSMFPDSSEPAERVQQRTHPHCSTLFMRSLIPLVVALLLLLPAELAAQRWRQQPGGPWAVEIDIRSSILLDDEVLYAGARLTRELTPLFTAGVALSVLTEEATRRTEGGIETIELLGAIGPRIEFMDTLRSRVDYFVGISGGIGYARRRTAGPESEIIDAGIFAMAEPEIGILVRASRRFRFRISLSGMIGRIETSDSLIYGGPSATFGVRMNL